MNGILDRLNKPKTYLLLANFLLVLFLIMLFNLGVLPIKNIGDFIFYSIIYLAFALYRPGWSFLFFVGTIALENINLAPGEIGITVRPYQFIGGLTVLAVLIKMAVKRLGFQLPEWNRYDLLFVIFAIAGFLSAAFASDKPASLKQAAIAASFVAFYFLTRIFIQNIGDLKRVLPFFLSSSVVVVSYGIWQNIRFARNLISFEVMPGRPNATFTEPDWYGIFLVLFLAVIYSLIYHAQKNNKFFNLLIASCWLLATLAFISLILTVSRSAWLGAFAVTFIFLFVVWTNLKFNPKNWFAAAKKTVLLIKVPIILSLLCGIMIVYFFNLTSFQLFNRAQSTGTGLQKITISCKETGVILPDRIGTSEELIRYGCRHINLEEIKIEEARGYAIKEIYRPDPNVSIRGEIYQKSWEEIKNHPIAGIGWGNISRILGTDSRGSGLNSSNIFLEVWLGTGLAGITAFSLALIFFLMNAIKNFLWNSEMKIFGLFLLLGFFAVIVPNFFNAGIMLGFVWIFLALAPIKE